MQTVVRGLKPCKVAPCIVWPPEMHGHGRGARAYSALMKSITRTLDDKTLDAGRAYAHRHHMTLDAVVRRLLHKAIVADKQTLVSELFRMASAQPTDGTTLHGSRTAS
jgi:hypothetical protein